MEKTDNVGSPRLQDLIEDSATKDDTNLVEDYRTEDDSEFIKDPEIESSNVHEPPFEVEGMFISRYVGYKEVEIPDWLKEHDMYKPRDWRAFKKPRTKGADEWKYAHREYIRMFRTQPDVEWFLKRILSEGRELYDGKKLVKLEAILSQNLRGERASDVGVQSNGNSSRSSNAICIKGRGKGTSLAYHDMDKLPLPNGNSSVSSKVVCARGRGTSVVYGGVDKLPLPNGNVSSSNMTISTRGRGRGRGRRGRGRETSAVCRAVDNLTDPGFV